MCRCIWSFSLCSFHCAHSRQQATLGLGGCVRGYQALEAYRPRLETRAADDEGDLALLAGDMLAVRIYH